MKGTKVLSLLVLTSSLTLAQSTGISGNQTSIVPDGKLAEVPNSISAPSPAPYIENTIAIPPKISKGEHPRFFDKRNLELFGVNALAQTQALLAIQSHGAAVQSRGRTLDPFEKHFESYGYGWGAVYRYGGGIGLNTFVAYVFHATGHHKLERWVPYIAMAHAEAATGYALTGSKQGRTGW